MVTAKRHETLFIEHIQTFFFFAITNSRREKETHSKSLFVLWPNNKSKKCSPYKKNIKWNWKERERETKWLIKLDISINNFFPSLLTSNEDHPSNSFAHLHFVYIKKCDIHSALLWNVHFYLSHDANLLKCGVDDDGGTHWKCEKFVPTKQLSTRFRNAFFTHLIITMQMEMSRIILPISSQDRRV